jgi:hypothetical protein
MSRLWNGGRAKESGGVLYIGLQASACQRGWYHEYLYSRVAGIAFQ